MSWLLFGCKTFEGPGVKTGHEVRLQEGTGLLGGEGTPAAMLVLSCVVLSPIF